MILESPNDALRPFYFDKNVPRLLKNANLFKLYPGNWTHWHSKGMFAFYFQ